VDAEVARTGKTALEAAQGIVDAAHASEAASAAIDAKRLTAKAAINAATTAPEIDAVVLELTL
jgi:hypothetical protein